MKVDLRKSLFILPNLFTLSSVLCGYYAILICASSPTDDDLYRSALLIILAMFFDTIDGRVARLTKTQTAIGVQLDSLADVISFGVAPAVLVYKWSLQELGFIGVFIGFVYVSCGTIRLARFNVLTTDDDGRPQTPSKYILGLPIPAAAGILISLVAASTVTERLPFAPQITATLVIALAIFMVSTIRFRSFKDLRISWRSVIFIVVALGSTIVVALEYHPSFALVWMLGCYVAIGLLEWLFRFVFRKQKQSEPLEK